MPLPYGETWQRWGEAVRQNLQDVGINLEIVATDVPGYNQRLSEWDYDIGFSYLYQSGDPALGVARSYISSNIAKGSPFTKAEGYSNTEVHKSFTEQAVPPTDSQRQEPKKKET